MKVGKKQYFAYRSFWPELETMKKFREEIGVDTFNIMISNCNNSLGFPYTKYPPVWKWNNQYDLAAFDKPLDDVIEVIPDAKFIILLDLNTPLWWSRYLGAFGVRYDSFYNLGQISSSDTWRQDTKEYMQTVMKHAKEKYGSRIVAYMLGCGGATEWHDRSRHEESVYKLYAYRQWQEKNHLPLTDIPGRMRRDNGRYDFDNNYKSSGSYYNGNDPTGGVYKALFPEFGLFRTPKEDSDVINYLHFCNEFNAQTVSFFLAAAREVVTQETELGCFFGYCFSTWTMTAGHLAYEQLLQDKNLDFVAAPIINYKIGNNGTSATIHKTIKMHGKQMLHEMDQKTYCYNRKMTDYCELPDPNKVKKVAWEECTGKDLAQKFTFGTGNGWIDENSVAAGLKRDISMALINGDSLWCFDMWGGFYQGEKVYSALRNIKKIWDEESGHNAEPTAEVLVVADPDNMYLLNDLNDRCETFTRASLTVLGRSGMPYEICSFNDLSQMNTERYKFVIMSMPFQLSAKKMAVLKDKILNNNRSVLWFYGPVIDDAGEWNTDNVEKICGIPFGTQSLSSREMGNWRSLYFHKPENLTPEELIPFLWEAGCHAYCRMPRSITANEKLVCVHTAEAEGLTVHLPRKYRKVTELFSNRSWSDASAVTLTSQGPDTFLLCLENQ